MNSSGDCPGRGGGLPTGCRKVSDGVGADGVGAKFPLLQFFCSFPRGRKLRDHRQQLPANVQNTLNSPQTKKNVKNEEKRKRQKKKKTKKNEKKKKKKSQKRGKNENLKKERKTQAKCKHDRETKKKRKEREIHSNPIYTNPIENFPRVGGGSPDL